MNILQLSGVLPRDAQFREYVRELGCADAIEPDQAAEFIRRVSEVKSRRELATDEAAARRFEIYVRRPFVAWREKQKEMA